MPSRTSSAAARPLCGRADMQEVSLRLLLWGPALPVLALLGLFGLSWGTDGRRSPLGGRPVFRRYRQTVPSPPAFGARRVIGNIS